MLRALTRAAAACGLLACMAGPSPEPSEVEGQVDGGDAGGGDEASGNTEPERAAGVVTGTPAPGLDLERIDAPGRWRLDDLTSSPEGSCPNGALLAFMASWCGPCAASLPTLVALEREHPDLEVVTVVVDETPRGRHAELNKVRTTGLTGPVVVADPATTRTWTGGTQSVPRFVFVDRSGTIVAQDRGFGDDVEALMRRQARRTVGP